ncbi:MAG: hypothetical protein ACK4LQ_03220 [Pararhodobacter sp.]
MPLYTPTPPARSRAAPALVPPPARRPAAPHRRWLTQLTLALGGLVLALPLGTKIMAETMAETSVRAITLSTAGLAMVEATGTIGAEPLRLSVGRGDIDDLLKSLWVLDPAGALAHLSLQGPGAFEDAFSHLPIAPQDAIDPARLLAAMVGAPISVERRGESWRGINMGITERPCEHGRCTVLNLQADDGTLRSFEMSDALSFAFTEDADRAAVSSALAAWRSAANDRRIEVNIASSDPAEREIGLVWLQQAPLWRTAWRAVDTPEGIELIGWAVVENTTGHDWHDIRLTLATGATRAIAARLYERRMVGREILDDAPPMALEATHMPMARGAAYEGMPLMAIGDTAVAESHADDGASFSRFTLSEPVTLAAGQMISLPFLRERLPDARRTLYTGGRGAVHPAIVLELENPLPLRLPAGVLTLYEAGRGHAGDATIPEIPPGGQVSAPFGQDTAMEVRESHAATETLREMRLVHGVLHVTEDLERTTTYRIQGAPQAERLLTLDHPRRDGWGLANPDDAEERLDAWRWQIAVPAGETVTHAVAERQPRLRRVALIDADLPVLAQWESRASDPALRARLAELGALRRQIAEAETRLRHGAEDARALETEQDRLVNLIVQLGDDSSANRDRRARVDAIDGELNALAEARRQTQGEIEALRGQFADLLE